MENDQSMKARSTQPIVLPLAGSRSQKDRQPLEVRDPEVTEKPVRRKFPAAYKQRILAMADACLEPGSLGRLLRQEGLYSSHLTTWRRQRDAAVIQGLEPLRRGRKARVPNPLLPELEALRKENRHLSKRLKQAEMIIEVQKKISQILGLDNPKSGENA
jgi:transposase-like protein